MSNERVVFKAKFRKTTDVREILERNSFTNAITEQMWRGFQAGAEWQRSIDKGLVEALETIALESTDEQARCCAHHYLAAYRAAQEGK